GRRCDRGDPLSVRPRLALPVDRPAACHRRARRPGQHGRCRAGCGDVRDRRDDDGRVHLTGVGDRRAVRDRLRRTPGPAAGSARHEAARRRGGRMSEAPTTHAARPVWLSRIALGIAAVYVLIYPLISNDLYYQNMYITSLVFAVAASG